MVTQHYRWDFIGLSTDTKPTPETSEKVVDGSTYYEADTSKLYVYCKNNWYEKKSLGGDSNTFDITELFALGDSAVIESGESSANIEITEKQFNDVLNAVKSGKIAEVKYDIPEFTNYVHYLASSCYSHYGEEKDWTITLPYDSGYYFLYASYFADEQAYILEFSYYNYVIDEGE